MDVLPRGDTINGEICCETIEYCFNSGAKYEDGKDKIAFAKLVELFSLQNHAITPFTLQ